MWTQEGSRQSERWLILIQLLMTSGAEEMLGLIAVLSLLYTPSTSTLDQVNNALYVNFRPTELVPNGLDWAPVCIRKVKDRSLPLDPLIPLDTMI